MYPIHIFASFLTKDEDWYFEMPRSRHLGEWRLLIVLDTWLLVSQEK